MINSLLTPHRQSRLHTILSLQLGSCEKSPTEPILLADLALAALWRLETSLLEAAASIGLVGERISTRGMVLCLTSGTAVEEDARAEEMALKVLSVIRRSGDPFSASVAVLRRIEAAAAPIGQTHDEGDRLEDAELPMAVDAGRSWSHVPILAVWRAAASYAFRSRRSSPVAERLVFMGWKVLRGTCEVCLPIRGLAAIMPKRGQGAC